MKNEEEIRDEIRKLEKLNEEYKDLSDKDIISKKEYYNLLKGSTDMIFALNWVIDDE